MSNEEKRNIYPITDWGLFLKEAKVEFEKLIRVRGSSDVSVTDFEFMRTLGVGAFGRVLLASLKSDNSYHAIKVINKKKIIKNKQTKHVINEKRILQTLNFPFVIHLNYAFYDNSFIYFAMPFINGGEMFAHLKMNNRFSENLSKFYGAQILLGLEYLHFCDMIYRDLKPENIMIDNLGYIKITDFGFCKVVKERTYTLCGTPEYLAPEVILNKPYGKAVDWWAFGILLYEMVAGYPPFHADEAMKIYEKVITGKYKFPHHFSDELRDIIRNTLQIDVSKRYGALKGGTDELKTHKWFRSISWMALLNYKMEPEFVPRLSDATDSRYFKKHKEGHFHISTVDNYHHDFAEF